MKSVRIKDTTAATKEREKIGKSLRDVIIKILEKQEKGASGYELTSLLKHEVKSPGTIKSALDKLKEEDKIIQKEFKQDGRKINQYFIKKLHIPGFMSIERNQLSNKWRNYAFVYSENMENIVVVPNEIKDSNKRVYKIELQINLDSIKFHLPSEFIDFYQLKERGISTEIIDDEILIHVGSKPRIITKPPRKFNILLADDELDDEIIKNLIKKLKGYNHYVEKVSTSDDFKKIVSSKKFDFLIFDMTMEAKKREKLEKTIDLFHKKNSKANSIIITTQVYGKPQIREYTKKGFSWFYDKDTPKLEEKIHTKMIEEA